MDKRLHVLVLGPSLFSGMASTRRLQNNLIPSIKSEGIRVSNLILGGNLDKDNSLLNEIDSCRIIYRIYNPLSVLDYYNIGRQFIKNMFNSGDNNLLYVYGYPCINNIMFIRYGQKLGYKIIFDIVEDNNLITNFKNILSIIKNRTSLYFFKRINEIADGVIVISDHLITLVSKYLGKKPLIKIPISIDIESIIASENMKIESDNKTIKIFYGGSFGPKDGLNILLHAIKIISNQRDNIRLILTGHGAKRNMDQFYKLIDELGLEDYVDYLGFLSSADYYKILMHADILCMTRVDTPFAHAGFPFKLGEMLITGRPVIASRVGDIEKYLDENSALLIRPGSVKELVDAIDYLIRNPLAAKKIGIQGKYMAIENFDAIRISKILYGFLNSL